MSPRKSATIKSEPLIVSADVGRDIIPEELELIEAINRKFPKTEIKLIFIDKLLNAYLYKLDPANYLAEIQKLIIEKGLDKRYEDGLNNPFLELVNRIISIGSYGIKSGKRLYAGYADERKVTGRKEKVSARETYFYARNNDFKTIRNQIPEDYINAINCGDSEEVLRHLPDNCVDLIITSPPYNFGLNYSASGDSAHWEAYLDKLFRVFSEGIRVLTFGGRFIVNVQPLFSDYIPLHHLISSFFMNKKMIWKGEILWEKNNYNCKYTSWGSWKSPSSPYLKYTWEFIEIFCKGSLKKPGLSDMVDITDEEFKTWVVAKWSIGPERRMKEFNHPAMFPEDLVERCLKLFSFQNDLILDPFNGAGTTTAVAAKLKRRYLGIDISPEYCEAAKERLSNPVNCKMQNKMVKKSNKTTVSSTKAEGKRRRGRPPKQHIPEKESSSQHLLDMLYSSDD